MIDSVCDRFDDGIVAGSVMLHSSLRLLLVPFLVGLSASTLLAQIRIDSQFRGVSTFASADDGQGSTNYDSHTDSATNNDFYSHTVGSSANLGDIYPNSIASINSGSTIKSLYGNGHTDANTAIGFFESSTSSAGSGVDIFFHVLNHAVYTFQGSTSSNRDNGNANSSISLLEDGNAIAAVPFNSSIYQSLDLFAGLNYELQASGRAYANLDGYNYLFAAGSADYSYGLSTTAPCPAAAWPMVFGLIASGLKRRRG